MSGPIIRKYGFPNHEQIFGARPLEHGAETEADAAKPADADPKATPEAKSKAKDAPKKKKTK